MANPSGGHSADRQDMTFSGHLEVLRRMLFRVLGVAVSIGVVVFCFKELTFDILLAPSHWDFMTYRWLESAMKAMGIDFHFQEYHVKM
ncbi:MAG: twin-arginine translocase subunit TatC, partial [Bacteroidaceae bacterium]